jgi:hypothetical protein
MAKFAVQGFAAERIYVALGTSPDKMSTGGNVAVSLGSGAAWPALCRFRVPTPDLYGPC